MLICLGTLVELSKYGNCYEVSGDEDKVASHEASKFRRLEQYDCILV